MKEDYEAMLKECAVIELTSKDEIEKLRAFSREKWIRDAIALENQGRKEGLKKGLKESEKKGKIEFAKKLLAKGLLSIDEIIENAELSEEEVKELTKVT